MDHLVYKYGYQQSLGPIADPQLSQTSQTTALSEQMSQHLLAHEEIVLTTEQNAKEIEKEGMRMVRNLIS